jgi:hypothetical protein
MDVSKHSMKDLKRGEVFDTSDLPEAELIELTGDVEVVINPTVHLPHISNFNLQMR